MKKPNPFTGKRKPKLSALQLQEALTAPPERMHRRLWLAAKVIVGFFVSAIGLVGSMYGISGPPWPVEPVFSPGLPSAGSPFDVPFSVTNKSAFFDIWNFRIKCHIHRATFAADAEDGSRLEMNEILLDLTITNPILAAGETDSYICPVRPLIVVGKRSAADAHLEGVVISFQSEYDAEILKGRHRAESGTFTLNTRTNPPQWMSGKLLR